MQMKLFGLSETKLFHCHRIFKTGGGGGGGAGRGFEGTPFGSATVRNTISLGLRRETI